MLCIDVDSRSDCRSLTYLVCCIDLNSRSACPGLPGRCGVQAFEDVVIGGALGSEANNYSCRVLHALVGKSDSPSCVLIFLPLKLYHVHRSVHRSWCVCSVTTESQVVTGLDGFEDLQVSSWCQLRCVLLQEPMSLCGHFEAHGNVVMFTGFGAKVSSSSLTPPYSCTGAGVLSDVRLIAIICTHASANEAQHQLTNIHALQTLSQGENQLSS